MFPLWVDMSTRVWKAHGAGTSAHCTQLRVKGEESCSQRKDWAKVSLLVAGDRHNIAQSHSGG